VVAKGQLWWEEAVPAESIFAGPLVSVRKEAETLVDTIGPGIASSLQIGGKASVGRGLANVRIA
jgi:CRISPR-associated protein Cmr4